MRVKIKNTDLCKGKQAAEPIIKDYGEHTLKRWNALLIEVAEMRKKENDNARKKEK